MSTVLEFRDVNASYAGAHILQNVSFAIDEGETVNNGVMVAGYVVMRIPMIFLWARAARHDPARRSAATTYIWTIAVAQVFWIALALADLPSPLVGQPRIFLRALRLPQVAVNPREAGIGCGEVRIELDRSKEERDRSSRVR